MNEKTVQERLFNAPAGMFRPRMVLCILAIVSLILGSQPFAVPEVARASPAQVVFPGAAWETRTCSQVGLDSAKIEQFVTNLKTGAISNGVIIKDGYLVRTWGSASGKVNWGSATKPVTTTLLFFAVQEGRLSSVDALIRPYVKSLWNKDLSAKDQPMTFRHLANMTSGYALPEAPGAAWGYNDYAIQLYNKVLYDGVFASPNNANAVALTANRLGALKFQDGAIFGGPSPYRLYTSPRDFARIGWLWLNRGRWGGQQLLDSAFFDQFQVASVPAGLPRTAGGVNDYLNIGTSGGGTDQTPYGPGVYGFNWWYNTTVPGAGKRNWPDAPVDAYQANGHWNVEVLVVLPSLNMVVAANGNWGAFQPGSTTSMMNQNLKLLVEAAANGPVVPTATRTPTQPPTPTRTPTNPPPTVVPPTAVPPTTVPPTIPPPPDPPGATVLANASFEADGNTDGIPDGWTGNNLGSQDRLATAYAPDGSRAFRFGPATAIKAYKGLSQMVNVQGSAGEVWEARLWARTDLDAATGNNRVRIEFVTPANAKRSVSSPIGKSAQGAYFTIPLVAPEGYVRLTFYLESALIDSNTDLDAVQLVNVSAPSDPISPPTATEQPTQAPPPPTPTVPIPTATLAPPPTATTAPTVTPPPTSLPTAAPTQTTPPSGLLANPSFEIDADADGLADGWTGSNLGAQDRLAASLAPDGSYVFQFGPAAALKEYKGLSQVVEQAGSAGEVWEVLLWSRTDLDAATGNNRVRITFISPAGTKRNVSSPIGKSAQGSYFTVLLAAPENYDRLILYLESALIDSSTYLDNVQLGKR